MKYWLDAEFIDDGLIIDLISIAMVAEDGREYYGQSVEFNHRNTSLWVQENVFPGLLSCPYQRDTHLFTTPYSLEVGLQLHGPRGANLSRGQCTSEQRKSDPGNFLVSNVTVSLSERDCPWRSRTQIANEIAAFCNPEHHGKPEFWTYYGSYDHVALAQLYGPMIGLPPGWPMYTMDIKQWCVQLGDPQLPEQTRAMEHNALNDARWNKVAWEFLRDLQATRHGENTAQ